jgi:putative ABC transport system permease protein
MLGAFVTYAASHVDSLAVGAVFGGVLVALLAVFAAAGQALLILARRMRRVSWPFVLRHGVANLYRPGNQTLLVLCAVGVSTLLVCLIYLLKVSFLHHVEGLSQEGRPNLVLVDVQPDQTTEMESMLLEYGISQSRPVPMVTMSLEKVKGREVRDILKEVKDSWRGRAFRRQYRSTYRNHLIDTEELIAGKLHDSEWDRREPVPVSVEEGIAERLGVILGDTLAFDVQGLPLETRITSMRKVDWQRVQPNFFVVFPEGVLEDAPQFLAYAVRTASKDQMAQLITNLRKEFPNVTPVDLSSLIAALDDVLTKVTTATSFMASFSAAAALLALWCAIALSLGNRAREAALLKALGASRRQVSSIVAVEFAALGSLGSLLGIALSLVCLALASSYVFDMAFHVDLSFLALVYLAVVLATALSGMLLCRRIYRVSAASAIRV